MIPWLAVHTAPNKVVGPSLPGTTATVARDSVPGREGSLSQYRKVPELYQ